MSKSGLPTPTPQLVTLQLTHEEAIVIAFLAVEAIKYGQFSEPGSNPDNSTHCLAVVKKIHAKLTHKPSNHQEGK